MVLIDQDQLLELANSWVKTWPDAHLRRVLEWIQLMRWALETRHEERTEIAIEAGAGWAFPEAYDDVLRQLRDLEVRIKQEQLRRIPEINRWAAYVPKEG